MMKSYSRHSSKATIQEVRALAQLLRRADWITTGALTRHKKAIPIREWRTRCQYSGSSWGVTGSARVRQRRSVSSLVATSRRHMRSSRTVATSASYAALASASFLSRAASARASAASGAFGSCSNRNTEHGAAWQGMAGHLSRNTVLTGYVLQRLLSMRSQ